MNAIVRLAWDRLSIFARIMGDAQGRVIVTLFYYTLLVPFGVGSRLLSDPLRLRPTTLIWQARAKVSDRLEDAQAQG